MRITDEIKKIDKLVGERIAEARISNGLSRTQLASKIGVTHQQLQKYEKGTNRICIGRLLMLCKAVRKPVSYFVTEEAISMPTLHRRLALEVSRNFMNIKSEAHQVAVATLVKSLAGE